MAGARSVSHLLSERSCLVGYLELPARGQRRRVVVIPVTQLSRRLATLAKPHRRVLEGCRWIPYCRESITGRRARRRDDSHLGLAATSWSSEVNQRETSERLERDRDQWETYSQSGTMYVEDGVRPSSAVREPGEDTRAPTV